jgi:hypothetical protein
MGGHLQSKGVGVMALLLDSACSTRRLDISELASRAGHGPGGKFA